MVGNNYCAKQGMEDAEIIKKLKELGKEITDDFKTTYCISCCSGCVC